MISKEWYCCQQWPCKTMRIFNKQEKCNYLPKFVLNWNIVSVLYTLQILVTLTNKTDRSIEHLLTLNIRILTLIHIFAQICAYFLFRNLLYWYSYSHSFANVCKHICGRMRILELEAFPAFFGLKLCINISQSFHTFITL